MAKTSISEETLKNDCGLNIRLFLFQSVNRSVMKLGYNTQIIGSAGPSMKYFWFSYVNRIVIAEAVLFVVAVFYKV